MDRMNDDYYLQIIAENLNHYMRLYNIRQVELARRVGVNKSTVHQWVYGKKAPRMDKVDMLCQIFGITRRQLLERREDSIEDEYGLDTTRKELHAIIDRLPDDRLDQILRVVQALED